MRQRTALQKTYHFVLVTKVGRILIGREKERLHRKENEGK